jgi:hypothetical protein
MSVFPFDFGVDHQGGKFLWEVSYEVLAYDEASPTNPLRSNPAARTADAPLHVALDARPSDVVPSIADRVRMMGGGVHGR